MSKYTKSDAAKDTRSSSREVSKAHHDARSDSAARSGHDARHFNLHQAGQIGPHPREHLYFQRASNTLIRHGVSKTNPF